MSKFKVGDKVFLNKRGIFGFETRDYTLGCQDGSNVLIKNCIYTVNYADTGGNVRVNGSRLYINENHFKIKSDA